MTHWLAQAHALIPVTIALVALAGLELIQRRYGKPASPCTSCGR